MQNMLNLAGLNLNLLVSLKALLEMRNVSAAAGSLHMTPPTMSRNLARLREYFRDPLLVRAGKGYILSEAAVRVKVRLDEVLEGIGGLFESGFEPATHAREFIIAAPDYVVQNVLCDAMAFLLAMDSRLVFSLVNWDASAKEALLSGKIHLAVSIDSDFPGNMHRRVVDEDDLVFVARQGHPIWRAGQVSLEAFVSSPQMAVTTGGGWNDCIDRPLQKLGLKRLVKLRVGSYGAAFAIAAKADLIFVVPGHVARNSPEARKFRIGVLPYETERIRFSLWWHECHQGDAAHKWLREELFPRILKHPNQRGLSAAAGAGGR
jgi:DNA-binding transcriptional LysR family regulator